MSGPRLVTPDLVEDQCIEVLWRRHPEHLAALERDRELAPETIERLKTVDILVGEGFRLREDKPPAVLLGLFGFADRPTPDAERRLTMRWTLALEVTVVGTNRRDTVKRRGWYTMTVVECLLARLPRDVEIVDTLELADIDFVNAVDRADKQARTLGQARVLFDVTTREGLQLHALPPDNSPLPPGSPGGPPEEPYTPPVLYPPIANATTQTEREPTP